MRHLEKIKIVDKTFPGAKVLKKNWEITCKSVNLLVGDQGCGKSTLLKLLQKNHSDIELTLSKRTKKEGVSSFYFAQKRNLRSRPVAL